MSRRYLHIHEYQQLFVAFPRGLTAVQIARRLRITRSYVYQLSNRLGYPLQVHQSAAQRRAPVIALLPPGLTISQIAARARISDAEARNCCRELGYAWRRCQPASVRYGAAFSRLPPGLTVPEVARRLRITHAQAYQYSRELGYQLKLRSPNGSLKISWKQWKQVDWEISNAEIARRTGVSRERVRQVRQQIGRPPYPRIPVVRNET